MSSEPKKEKDKPVGGDRTTISVYELVGSPLCVASDDGQKVHDQIAKGIRDRNVVLSFKNVTGLTSAFLNAAIGQLYGSLDPQVIRNRLKVVDMIPEDLQLLRRVVETARQYFKNPKVFDKAVREVLGDETSGT